MTRISATKGEKDPSQATEVLAAIVRRASHEVRNALNASAVNVEVVRSRIGKPDPDLAQLRTFAERASRDGDATASLAGGLADLARLLARAAGVDGKPTVQPGENASRIVVVPLCSSEDNEISADLKALAVRAGFAIRLDGPTVIFTVRD